MSHAVEMLGRLNPATIRYNTGRGGLPELTAQDIAGAIAFVPAGLGREMLLAVGWPDGANMRRVMELACDLAHAELQRQHEAITRAGIAHSIDSWNKRRVPAKPALAQHWPRTSHERLPAIVAACVDEIAKPNHCASCEGRGEIHRGDLKVMCPQCGGSGIVPVSDRKRAAAMGLSHQTYSERGWDRVYNWMLSAMRDSYYPAARALNAALAG